MPSPSFSFRDIILVLNLLAAMTLAVYALNQAALLAIYLRRRFGAQRQSARDAPHLGASAPAPTLPDVTVQVPLYNERYVAQRMIAALSALDYPRSQLHIQVLDDSTDDTLRIAQRAAEAARASGTDIQVIHRDHREGYKAGALGNGLRAVTSDYVAIFDADFIPKPNFLRVVFADWRPFDDPAVGFAQTRWGFLNRETTALTRGQALLLDMHFNIDQPARSGSGLLMNFNGSGGVWRRACIEDAGGWQADTLTEDLDLSYRAELRGWRGAYLADQVSPGELPESVVSYKRQQARWARGTAQCVRKLLPTIARSSFSLPKRLAGGLHISGYMTCPLMLWLAISTPYLAVETHGALVAPGWMSIVGLIGLLPTVSMFVAHTVQGRRPITFFRDLPAAVIFSIGLSLSNTAAVFVGLLAKGSGVFDRTPKRLSDTPPAGVPDTSPVAQNQRESAQAAAHAAAPDWVTWGELGLAIYILVFCAALLRAGQWASLPALLVYGSSFAGVALSQLVPWLWSSPPGRGDSSEPRSAVGSRTAPGR